MTRTSLGAVVVRVAGALSPCAFDACAYGDFVGFSVTSNTVVQQGQSLVVYTVAARFDGPTDTLFRAYDLTAENSQWFQGFWHQDYNTDLGDPVLSQTHGTWDPSRTGSANRAFDSYLTIGGIAGWGNSTEDSFDDIFSTQAVSSSWNRASLPWGDDFAWFNSEPGNGQGRVGNSPGLRQSDVRIGQFVLSEGHAARTYSLSIRFNAGDWFDRDGDGKGDWMHTATGSFTLGVPAPGAIAVLGLAGLLGRRRR